MSTRQGCPSDQVLRPFAECRNPGLMIFWKLKLLGHCQLYTRDDSPVRLPTRKASLLLAYLGTHPRRSASRQLLSDLLWEDAEPAQGRLHLRKALWLIRTAAEKIQSGSPSPIETEGDQVRLSSSVQVDVTAFMEAVEAAGDHADALRAASALYRAEFLGDMPLRQGPTLTDWASAQRDRLGTIAAGALLKQGEFLGGNSDRLSEAEEAVRKALEIDPLQEHGHRLLMDILNRQGRTSAAAQQYRDLRMLLERELDVTPEPATEDLHRRLLQERAPAIPPIASPAAPAPEAAAPTGSVAPSSRRSPVWTAAGAIALVLAVSGTAINLSAAQVDPAPKIKRIFPVVTGLQTVGEPTLSPDGSRFVFAARTAEGPQKLYLMTLGASGPLTFTSGPGSDDDPAWSPDGSSIAFTRAEGGVTKIVVKGMPNGFERTIARLKGASGSVLSWARDGASLFAADAEAHGRTTAIVRIELKDGSRRVVTHPAQDFSGDRLPLAVDGNTLVFLRASSRAASEIMQVGLQSGSVRQLTNDHASIADVAAGPGKGELLFSSDRGGDAGLWSINRAGGPPSRVSEGLLRYHEMSSDSSGRRLLFEGIRDRSSLSLLVPGASPIEITDGDFREWFPALARDGAVAFVSTRSGGQQLWLKAAGREPVQMTRLPRWQIDDPRWSPDGRTIAFVGSGPQRTDLFVTGRGDGMLSRLTTDGSEKRSPVWALDGRSVYFVRRHAGQHRVWRVAARSGAEARPVSGTGPIDIRIDPGGRWMYFLLPGRNGVFRQPLTAVGGMSGPVELVLRTERSPPFSWDVSRSAIYLIDRGQLQRADLATGKAAPVISAAGLHARSPFTIGSNGTVLLNRQDLKVELYGIDFEQD